MNQIVEWLHKGKSIKMMGQDGNIYDAVEFASFNLGDFYNNKSIDDSMWVYHIFKPLSHSDFVAMIRAKSDDRVYLTFLNSIPDNEIKSRFEMMELAQKITDESKEPESVKNREIEFLNNLDEDKRLIIPKINFEGDVKIDWIKNMQTLGGWFISWAVMKVKLRLNHIGARAQGVAVMSMTLGDPPIPKILKFDRPFMIWFTHQGKVTFVMYVDYADWKDPGDEIFS